MKCLIDVAIAVCQYLYNNNYDYNITNFYSGLGKNNNLTTQRSNQTCKTISTYLLIYLVVFFFFFFLSENFFFRLLFVVVCFIFLLSSLCLFFGCLSFSVLCVMLYFWVCVCVYFLFLSLSHFRSLSLCSLGVAI